MAPSFAYGEGKKLGSSLTTDFVLKRRHYMLYVKAWVYIPGPMYAHLVLLTSDRWNFGLSKRFPHYLRPVNSIDIFHIFKFHVIQGISISIPIKIS